jgi:hypothetical protein
MEKKKFIKLLKLLYNTEERLFSADLDDDENNFKRLFLYEENNDIELKKIIEKNIRNII